MSGSLRLAVYLFLGVLALFLVSHVVHFVIGLLSLLIPFLVLAGIGVLVFAVVNRKSIGPGRRRILP